MGRWAIFFLFAFSIPTGGEKNFGGWRAGKALGRNRVPEEKMDLASQAGH